MKQEITHTHTHTHTTLQEAANLYPAQNKSRISWISQVTACAHI